MSQSPTLAIEVFENDAAEYGGFGPGNLKATIWDALKIGWSWYSRFPGTMYFTLRQSSPTSAILTPGLDHLRVWYINEATGHKELVFCGRLGDADESAGDVVWRGHAYIAELALSRTGYRVMYAGKKISRAVAQEWKRDDTGKKAKKKYIDYGAKKQSYSLLGHIRTGRIQTPTNNSGKAMKLDPAFGVIDVPRLLFFYDLTEIGRANTNKNVTFGITRSTSPKFEFLKDAGTYRPELQLFYSPNGSGNIRDFRFVRGVTNIRNDLATIGSKRGSAVEIKRTRSGGTYGYEAFGRRQDVFAVKTLAGFRNLDTDSGAFSAQKQVTQRAVYEATRPMRVLQLDVPWQYLEPFKGWDIEDTTDVRIKAEDTQINTDYRFIGVTGVLDENGYRQQLYVQTENA